jgi:uncharacterized protein involved in exopolysaccharide biosynthesis
MSTVTKEPPALVLRLQPEALSPPPPDEVSFKDLVSILWQAKLSIAAIALVTLVSAVLLGLWMPRKYEATVILSPVTDEGNVGGKLSMVTSLMSQLGVAALAGGGSGNGRRAESLALLQSGVLTERYIRENQLLPVLFPKQWDTEKGRWRPTDPAKIPEEWDGNRAFRKIRNVADDAKTGLVKLTITWTDPKAAARWANDLVKLTNEQARARVISEAQRNITYLNEQAGKTTVAELRQAIYQLLEQEMKKEMLARGDDQYALRVIDPAEAPRRPTTPGPMLWALAGLGGGLLLAVVITLFRASWNGTAAARREQPPAGTVPFRR